MALPRVLRLPGVLWLPRLRRPLGDREPVILMIGTLRLQRPLRLHRPALLVRVAVV